MKTPKLLVGAVILLMFAGNTHAASFDCGKAASVVEKLICSDADLSKLDESMNEAYLKALQRTDLRERTIKSQRQWLKDVRDACQDAECVKNAYETRIKELGMPSGGQRSGAFSSRKSQASICEKVSKIIKEDTIDKHSPEVVHVPPREVQYLNLDIDGDGIADEAEVSSGEEGSYLSVELSGGTGYDLNTGGYIRLLRLKKHIYALVTYWKWDRHPDGSKTGKRTGRELYELTKTEAKLVCDMQDLERR